MTQLINIATDAEGDQVVSARELHRFLQVKARFNDWFKRRVAKYGFQELIDYQEVSSQPMTDPKLEEGVLLNSEYNPGGRPETDYALSLDMAKQLSMVENNEKGQQARQYFITCEKALRQIHQQTTLLADQRINALEQRVNQMIATPQHAAYLLQTAPRSTEAVPEETTRMKIIRLVNAYVRTTGYERPDVWHTVYDRLYTAYRIKLRQCKKLNDRESWLDVADRKGYLDKIYAIVSADLIIPALPAVSE